MISKNSINSFKPFLKNGKDVDETIRRYFKCLSNNNWKGFDFQNASAILMPEIRNALLEYGYLYQEEFILKKLESKFPCLSSQEIEMKQEVHKEVKDGILYYSFDCPYLCAHGKLEAKHFSELQNKYKDNLVLFELEELYIELKGTVNHGFVSQEEVIELIRKALYARTPRGAIFNLDVE